MTLDSKLDHFVTRRNATPCPKILWVSILRANDSPELGKLWSPNRSWARRHFRTIARSRTPFQLKNPELKEALQGLGLGWLTPRQIGRIRECPAPRREQPRRPIKRLFSWQKADPESFVRSPRCKQIFWAWRSDQRTCDSHRWAASILRVEKYLKTKKYAKRNALQLKDARGELKRKRRANRRAKRLAQSAPVLSVKPSQSRAQNEKADLQLLKLIRWGFEPEPSDSVRLEAMIREGYVLRDEAESEVYKLSGKGLQLLGQLRKRVTHALER